MNVLSSRRILFLFAAAVLIALPVVAQTAMLEGSAPDPATNSASTSSIQLQPQRAQFDSRPAYQTGSVTESQFKGGAAGNLGPGAGNLGAGAAGSLGAGAAGSLGAGAAGSLGTGAARLGTGAARLGAGASGNGFRAGMANSVSNGGANRERPLSAVHPRTTPVHTVYVKDNRTFWQKHPMVKGATIGAGVGAGAGALTGLVTHQGVIRGAVIGAGAGAGVGVIRTSKIMKRHPIARDVATGAVAGLGLGWAGSRWPHTVAATTGVGAAIGLGAGLLTHLRLSLIHI